jgi:signal transduction histidine kinase
MANRLRWHMALWAWTVQWSRSATRSWNSLRVRYALLILAALATVIVTTVLIYSVETALTRTEAMLPWGWQLVWGLAVVLVMGFAWLSLVQVVRPLRLLTEMVQAIGQGDYEAAAHPPLGIRELEQLRVTLDQMAHKILEAQEANEYYIEQLTHAEENERTRLARELHDEALQELAVVSRKLDNLRHELSAPFLAAASPLVEIQGLVTKLDQNLRNVESELRPPYLEDLGLVPALKEAADKVGAQFRLTGEEQRLNTDRALALLRMVQEALHNADRHAHAEQIELDVRYARDAVTVAIRDNGVGFEVPADRTAFARTKHFGLMDLYQRAHWLGARLEIESAPQCGTRITIRLPLACP